MKINYESIQDNDNMKERTYIISKQQQYVQSVDLKAGRYTINYSIRTPNTSHRFAFLKKSGGWQEFEMQNLTPGKWHRKDEAKLSFYLLEDVVAFNLCTSPVSVSSPVMIQKLMLEEGLNASTAKPNELDLLESIEDVFDMEHIFKPTVEMVQPETPESLQQDDYEPEGWEDDPVTATEEFPFVWHSFRQRIGNVWGAFYPPTLYSNYAKPGEDVKMIEIKGNTILKNPDKTGGVSSTTLTVVKHGFSTSIKWEFLYGSTWQETPWSSTTLVVDYSEHASLFVNGVATLRCVSTVNPEVFTVVSITAVWDGGEGITLVQSNQSHSFAGGVSAALPGSTTNTILAYKGGQQLTPTVTVDPFYLPAGMTRSVNGSEVTFTVTSQMTRPAGVIPIDVTVDGKTITVHFSYSIAFKGADGLTKDIRLEASSQVIQKLKDGTYMPSSVTVTATAVNTTVTTWTYSIDGVGFSYTPPAGVSRSENVVTINPATATQNMYVIRASDGTISDLLTVIRIEVPKDGEDGHSPYIGGNGNWWVWDDNQGKYVDSGDTAHGDDGKSPYIGANGNWYVWDGVQWVNTGIKARGEDGAPGADGKDGITPVVTQLVPSVILIGKSIGGDPQPNTFTVKHLDGSGNAVVVWLAAFGSDDGNVWYLIEYAEYASSIVVHVDAYPYKYFVVRSYSTNSFPAPEEVYWSTPYLLSVSVGMYEDGKDGLPGVPGQVPVQKEWVPGDRHRNSDEIVDYIYVRGSNSETSYWYQLIDKTDTLGIIAGAIPTGGSTPAGYKAVDWLKSLAVKTLIAEEANLANLIFKEGKLISIKGNTFAGEEINYGEYTEYNFASTTTQPAVDSASWLEIPPSTIRWIRYKKNTGSSWTVKQAGTGTGQWTMQFATAPEGETWYSSYSANRFWARVKVGGESDYGKPFKFTPAGGYDFIPNVIIDGENGEITGDSVTANNIRTKIRLVSSNNPTEIAAVLGNGFSVNLSASGTNPTDYAWYTITLPGDKELSGSILTIHAPTASVKRYKIKPSNPNALFYVNEPAQVLKELQVVQGVRGTIEMKAVWDELNGTLDWHVLSRVGYMVNYVQPTVLRVPPYFKPDELVYRGACSSAVALTKKYQSIISNVTAVKESSGSAWARIEVSMPTYYGPTGSVLRRTAFNSSDVLRLEVTSVSGGRTVYVYPSYISNSVWMFNVTLYNNSGTAVHEPFDFNIYTNDYFIQSEWMDNKLEDN